MVTPKYPVMASILKKLTLIICMFASVHHVQAQAPVKRLAPAGPSMQMHGKYPSMPQRKDPRLLMAELQKRNADRRMAVGAASPNTLRRPQARGLVAGRDLRNRSTAVLASTQAYRQRLMQRFPKMQIQQMQTQQQRKSFRTLSYRPAVTLNQVTATQREQARKRLEQARRQEFK
jgi:hypothetical protein